MGKCEHMNKNDGSRDSWHLDLDILPFGGGCIATRCCCCCWFIIIWSCWIEWVLFAIVRHGTFSVARWGLFLASLISHDVAFLFFFLFYKSFIVVLNVDYDSIPSAFPAISCCSDDVEMKKSRLFFFFFLMRRYETMSEVKHFHHFPSSWIPRCV